MPEASPFPAGLYNKSHGMRRGGGGFRTPATSRTPAGFRTPESRTGGSRTPGSPTRESRTPGSRARGSRTPGARTLGSRTPGSRTPGRRGRGLRVPPPAPTDNGTAMEATTTAANTGVEAEGRGDGLHNMPDGGGGGGCGSPYGSPRRRRRRPSTAIVIHTPSMARAPPPDLPLTSRVSIRTSTNAKRARSARAPRTTSGTRTGGGELGGGGGGGGGGESGGGGGGRGGGGDGELAVAMGKDVTTLEVHRTQWVEVEGGGDGGGGGGGGGRDGGGGEAGRIQSPRELSVVGRETYEGASLSARHRSRGNARKGDPGAVRPSTTTALKPRATIAWGEVAVGPSTSVSTVVRNSSLT